MYPNLVCFLDRPQIELLSSYWCGALLHVGLLDGLGCWDDEIDNQQKWIIPRKKNRSWFESNSVNLSVHVLMLKSISGLR